MFIKTLLATAALAALANAFPSSSKNPSLRRDRACNGHAELCDRGYGNITHLGAHDSYAYSSDPLALSRDQEVDIPTQLGLGVRLLQAQAHMSDGEPHFCHTSCTLFDGGTVLDYLNTVHTWLDANPSEVLTLLFTNPESLSLSDVWAPVFEQSGIASMAYVPPHTPMANHEWPTLSELIDSGKRVIIFLDNGPDTDSSVPYLLFEFNMIWETPWGVSDSTFPCTVDRIGSESTLTGAEFMYMINHMLYIDLFDADILISDPLQASTTNGVQSIMNNVQNCEPYGVGRPPNFILLDWVDKGSPLQAVNQLNGL